MEEGQWNNEDKKTFMKRLFLYKNKNTKIFVKIFNGFLLACLNYQQQQQHQEQNDENKVQNILDPYS